MTDDERIACWIDALRGRGPFTRAMRTRLADIFDPPSFKEDDPSLEASRWRSRPEGAAAQFAYSLSTGEARRLKKAFERLTEGERRWWLTILRGRYTGSSAGSYWRTELAKVLEQRVFAKRGQAPFTGYETSHRFFVAWGVLMIVDALQTRLKAEREAVMEVIKEAMGRRLLSRGPRSKKMDDPAKQHETLLDDLEKRFRTKEWEAHGSYSRADALEKWLERAGYPWGSDRQHPDFLPEEDS